MDSYDELGKSHTESIRIHIAFSVFGYYILIGDYFKVITNKFFFQISIKESNYYLVQSI